MKYIGSSPEHVILEMGGLTFYAKHNEVDLVPAELVTASDYYKVGQTVYCIITHTIISQKSARLNTQSDLLPRQWELEKAILVSTVSILKNRNSTNTITHYPYFQFQSVRQPSSYSWCGT